MTREAKGKPTRRTVERLARFSSLTLKVCGVCIGAFSALMLLFLFVGVPSVVMVCSVFFGVAFLVGALAGLVRVGISVFAETQMHLNEMLATVLVAGAVTVGPIQALDFGSADRDVARAVLGVFVLLMVGAGSTWGWSVCRQLGVGETWQRLRFLFYGWLYAAGVCSLAALGICCAAFLSGPAQDPHPAGFWITWAVSVLGSLLIIPAIRTERACRKKAKAAATPPPENPPPSA